MGGGGSGPRRQAEEEEGGPGGVEEGVVRAAGRGAVPVEATTCRAVHGTTCTRRGVWCVGRLLGRSIGPARDGQRRFVIIRKYSNDLN
jgi:hypothetical protein